MRETAYRFKRRVGEQHLHTAGGFVVGQVGRIQITFLSTQLKGHPRNKIHLHKERGRERTLTALWPCLA
jgi:hypothetical protein